MLSVVVPGIRCERWLELYSSIVDSLESKDFELIFVGPWQPIHSALNNAQNVKFIKSFRSPNACQQIGALYAEGEYIKFEADDCLFEPGALKRAIQSFNDTWDVVLTKYGEGGSVLDDTRYTYGMSYPSSPYIDRANVIFNSAIYKTKIFRRFGGFDCRFNVPCIGHADIGARIYLGGSRKITFNYETVCSCTHMPERTGDHWAIHDSQQQYDEPLFIEKWNQKHPPAIHIPFDNWRSTEKVWGGRFG